VEKQGRFNRGAEGVEEVGEMGRDIPLLIRMGRGIPFLIRLGGLEERHFDFWAIFCVKSTMFMLRFGEIYHVFFTRKAL